FHLLQRELMNWPGCDGFWNGCLLRRPARIFKESHDGMQENVDYRVDYADPGINVLDPGEVSQLRYLSRDWAQATGFDPAFAAPVAPSEPSQYGFNSFGRPTLAIDGDYLLAGERPIGPGVAG